MMTRMTIASASRAALIVLLSSATPATSLLFSLRSDVPLRPHSRPVASSLAPACGCSITSSQRAALSEPPKHFAPRRGGCPSCCASERDETFEALGIAGGLTAAVVVAYAGLTSLGLDDAVAGNLVLVGLAAVGAYLFFFDGGTTQAALQAVAVQEVADGEGAMMEAAPFEEDASRVGMPAVTVAADASIAAAAFAKDGLVRIDGVIDAAACTELREYVSTRLEESLAKVRAGEAKEDSLFGGVLSRTNRYDLLLPLEPPVSGALSQALGSLSGVVRECVGADAELFELAALVSDPNAPRQPVHPDTPFSDATAVCTAFIALQDIDETMGPTFFLSSTHTKAAHEAFNEGNLRKTTLLRATPRRLGLLKQAITQRPLFCSDPPQGDVSLFDSRLLHGGGANESPRRRVLFYFSFKASGARRVPPGSMLRSVRGKHTLQTLEEQKLR